MHSLKSMLKRLAESGTLGWNLLLGYSAAITFLFCSLCDLIWRIAPSGNIFGNIDTKTVSGAVLLTGMETGLLFYDFNVHIIGVFAYLGYLVVVLIYKQKAKRTAVEPETPAR